jgi:plastocyanin
VHWRNLTRGAVGLAVFVASLTACGGEDEPDAATATSGATTSSSTAAETGSSDGEVQSLVATEADFTITLDRQGLTAGEYEIEVVNEGATVHDLVVERDGEDIAESETLDPGQSGTVTVTLEPGEYVFYCSFHRGMGMEITVQVT